MTTPLFFLRQLTLSFDKSFLLNKDLAHNLNSQYPWIRLLYYGNSAILIIYGSRFVYDQPLWYTVQAVIQWLQAGNILSKNLNVLNCSLHEIIVGFNFIDCHPFWADPNFFHKKDNMYFSPDNKPKFRSDGSQKTYPKSFLCFEDLENKGANLIFTFSGDNCQYLSMNIINYSIPYLLPLLSQIITCKLTQVATPQTFKVKESLFSYFETYFTDIFDNAHWFDQDLFSRKRIDRNLWC
jgi:hypothetical protein